MQRIVRLVVVAALATFGIGAIGVPSAAPQTGPVGIATLITATDGDPFTFTCQVVNVDLGTGAVSPLGPEIDGLACPTDYAPRADGTIYGVTLDPFDPGPESSLVTVDPETGVQTVVGSLGLQIIDITGLEFDAAGTLYLFGSTDASPDCSDGACLYRIDAETGAATLIGGSSPDLGSQLAAGGLTRTCVDPLYTNTIEVIAPGSVDEAPDDAPADTPADTPPLSIFGGDGVAPDASGVGSLSTLDTTTGTVTDVGGPLTPGADFAAGLAYTDDGTLWGIVGSTYFGFPGRTWVSATIDPVTGAATAVAPIPLVSSDEVIQTLSGLTVGALDCTPAIVVTPTFTG